MHNNCVGDCHSADATRRKPDIVTQANTEPLPSSEWAGPASDAELPILTIGIWGAGPEVARAIEKQSAIKKDRERHRPPHASFTDEPVGTPPPAAPLGQSFGQPGQQNVEFTIEPVGCISND
jgi:hypothetical protein